MIESNTNIKPVVLFTPGQMEDKSDPFSFNTQVTIRATGMLEGDQVTFRLVKIKSGTLGYTCDCINVPPEPADIEAIQPLMCPDCSTEERQMVRLTPDNPVIILDYPQNTLMYAVYEGDGIGMASVTAVFGTTTQDLTPSMRGCPADCPSPDWQDTGTIRCDLESNTVLCQQTDGLGNTQWVECGNILWEDTGAVRVVAGIVEKQQVDQCGDYRWIEVPEEDIVWTPTQNIRCVVEQVDNGEENPDSSETPNVPETDGKDDSEDNESVATQAVIGDDGYEDFEDDLDDPDPENPENPDPENPENPDPENPENPDPKPEEPTLGEDEYRIEREYLDQFGRSKWEFDSVGKWLFTGTSACINHKINILQKTICGDERWKPTEVTCGYHATMPMPGGGFAFRPGMQDPTATVEMQDCDGNAIGYLYPEARHDASIEVTVDCGKGTVVGYAVNSNGGETNPGDKPQAEGFTGYLTHVPKLDIKSMPELKIANMPAVQDVRIVCMPRLAVGSFTWCNNVYILFNDGTYEKVNGSENEEPAKPIVPTVTVTYINARVEIGGGVGEVNEIVARGVPFALPDWTGEVAPGYEFLGWSRTAGSDVAELKAGQQVVPNFAMRFYAVWGLNENLGG